MRCRDTFVGVVSALLVTTGQTHAQEPALPDGEPVDLSGDVPAPTPELPDTEQSDLPQRRCGFTLGLQLGPFLGSARGFPNDSLKIDRDEFLTETGVGPGSAIGAYIGIALSDWFVFGIGPGFGRFTNGDLTTGHGSLMFHIDTFPAFSAGGAWEDLGVMLEVGVGVFQTTEADDDETLLIDSGAGSRLTVGAVWEGIQLWKLSMGPFLAADMMWSTTSSRPGGWVGWRTTFYGGP